MTQINAPSRCLEVLNPQAVLQPTLGRPAARLSSLAGKRIGLWWNTKANGDVVLGTLRDDLGTRIEDADFVSFAYIMPTPKRAYEDVRKNKPDVMITTTGD